VINLCCPACGNEFKPYPNLPEGAHKLSPQQLEIMSILAEYPQVFTSVETIARRLYALDPNGGPQNTRTIIQRQIYLIRQKIGDVIDTQKGSGYRLKKSSAMVAEETTEND
jgi:DNA-binding response OmpR family regulator